MRSVTSKIISLSDCLEVKEMKKRFQSGLTGLLFGGLWGGIVGAILVGLQIYFDDSSSIVGGAARNWTLIFAIIGLVVGLVVGAVLGAVIGATHADGPRGTLIGLAVGLLIAVALIYDSIDPFVFAVIVSCSILGWLISSTLPARDRPG